MSAARCGKRRRVMDVALLIQAALAATKRLNIAVGYRIVIRLAAMTSGISSKEAAGASFKICARQHGLPSIIGRRQRKSEALPDEVRLVHSNAVFIGDLPIERKRGSIIQIGGVQTEMFSQQLAAQRPHHASVPDRRVHLGVPGKRIGV
jgi:hypothetical protein